MRTPRKRPQGYERERSARRRAALVKVGGKSFHMHLSPADHHTVRLLMQRHGDTKMSATVHRLIERARV